MSNHLKHETWQQNIAVELAALTPILKTYGYTLDELQPHTLGERFLIQALTTVSGQKLILLAKNGDGLRAVIKVANDEAGKAEIEHERLCRNHINQLAFAYDIFAAPRELLHKNHGPYLISIQEYIEQEKSFLERSLLEQFDYALRALKAQEHSRATTSRHLNTIKSIFGLLQSADYLRLFEAFISQHQNPETIKLLQEAHGVLTQGRETIDQYGFFLTHTDFVPHNFRIRDAKLYLLDFSAIRFGNKHESWARLLNFMTLYNPALEAALLSYVRSNRAEEEYESLHLMRLFRLGEIITYYHKTLANSANNLLALNQARISFWSDVLRAELNHSTVAPEIRNRYITTRDELRSDDEKKRQQDLH